MFFVCMVVFGISSARNGGEVLCTGWEGGDDCIGCACREDEVVGGG